jgi:hypothetical protein
MLKVTSVHFQTDTMHTSTKLNYIMINLRITTIGLLIQTECFKGCMYVCIRGGLLQPLHLDPQWSIVLNPYDR